MRSMPSNSVLHKRGYLKGGFRWLAFATCVVAGCAKFPKNGDSTSFVKLTFRMKVLGTFNQNYFYDVAIRTSTDPNPPADPTKVPQPVIGQNNPNGRVAGSPGYFVEYAPSNPIGPDPFTLYRFATRDESPNPSDPDNDVNLGSFLPSTRGRIVTYSTMIPGTTNEFQFDLYVNLLADTDDKAKEIQALQVQFLTMSRLSNQGSGTRFYDYLGSLNQPEFIKIDLRSNNQYGNALGLLGSGIEPDNDCPDPDLNIVDWGVTVTRP